VFRNSWGRRTVPAECHWVSLIVPALKRSALLIFGFCTAEISGLTAAIGSEVVWVLVR
jgi:hypothetical protein